MKKIPKSLQNIDLDAVLRKRGIFVKQKQYLEIKEEARTVARKVVESRKKGKAVKEEERRHAQFTNQELLTYWSKQMHIVDTLEKHFEEKVRQFISKIEKDFLNNLEAEVDAKKSVIKAKTKDFFDNSEAEYLVKAQLDFTPLLESVATLSGQEAMKLAGVTDIYLPIQYRDKIRVNVDKFAKSLFDTDKDYLTNILFEGLKDGKSVPEIRSIITEQFPDYTKMQAQRITRTEVLRTSNQAAVDAYEQSGVVEGKQWLTAGADDECAKYEGEIVSLSANFYSGGNEFQDGDPPLHPNCRCVVVPVVVKD